MTLNDFVFELKLTVFKILKWSDRGNKGLLNDDSIADLFDTGLNWTIILFVIENINEYGRTYISFLMNLKYEFDTISHGEYEIYVKRGFSPEKRNNLNPIYINGKLIISGIETQIDQTKYTLYKILIESVKENRSSVELLNYLDREHRVLNILHAMTLEDNKEEKSYTIQLSLPLASINSLKSLGSFTRLQKLESSENDKNEINFY